jgi:hypothetical protein
VAEKHPVEEFPFDPETGERATLERRVQFLERRLSQLWDQVWWMNLPADKRKEYEAQGFKDPIRKFYIGD